MTALESSMAPRETTIAILSIGQMGLGIAQLLRAHDYRVATNVSDRSAATQGRARAADLHLADSDEELVAQADYVLSIVPPRDAVATAARIVAALGKREREKELWYIDMNAISPATAKRIAGMFAHQDNVRFLDGGIIGGPPRASPTEQSGWTRPDVPISGPHRLPDHLAAALNTRYINASIGAASGLKCCFAALSKGFTALALQSYTTAASLDVLVPLQEYLDAYNPGTRAKAERVMVACTGKAYRWVEEMNQIGDCFAGEGGWEAQAQVFREIAGVFQGLADVVEKKGTGGMEEVTGLVEVLGQELREERK